MIVLIGLLQVLLKIIYIACSNNMMMVFLITMLVIIIRVAVMVMVMIVSVGRSVDSVLCLVKM